MPNKDADQEPTANTKVIRYGHPTHRPKRKKRSAVTPRYIDPGRTGTTINRPAFKQMLADLAERRITHIVVHKLDRLSRSPKVDYVVDDAREKTKTALVSVTEYIDEAPQGLLNLQFMRGVAAYYSNNLASGYKRGSRRN